MSGSTDSAIKSSPISDRYVVTVYDTDAGAWTHTSLLLEDRWTGQMEYFSLYPDKRNIKAPSEISGLDDNDAEGGILHLYNQILRPALYIDGYFKDDRSELEAAGNEVKQIQFSLSKSEFSAMRQKAQEMKEKIESGDCKYSVLTPVGYNCGSWAREVILEGLKGRKGYEKLCLMAFSQRALFWPATFFAQVEEFVGNAGHAEFSSAADRDLAGLRLTPFLSAIESKPKIGGSTVSMVTSVTAGSAAFATTWTCSKSLTSSASKSLRSAPRMAIAMITAVGTAAVVGCLMEEKAPH